MSFLEELRDHFNTARNQELGPVINLFCGVLHASGLDGAAQSKLVREVKERGFAYWDGFIAVTGKFNGKGRGEEQFKAAWSFMSAEPAEKSSKAFATTPATTAKRLQLA